MAPHNQNTQPPPLDYQAPLPRGMPRWAQVVLGAAAFFAAVVVAFFGALLPYQLSPHRRIHLHPWNISGATAPDKALMDMLAWIGPILALTGLVLLTRYLVRRRLWRGFLIGVLLGFAGVVVLMAGLFFLASI